MAHLCGSSVEVAPPLPWGSPTQIHPLLKNTAAHFQLCRVPHKAVKVVGDLLDVHYMLIVWSICHGGEMEGNGK